MNILYHLFKKDSLHEIPLEVLEQFTTQYPFFPIGQFLLTKKMQDIGDDAFKKQFQKTLVYFHNPLWLQYQLNATIKIEAEEPATALPEVHVTSHDLIEDVILHQEIVYAVPEDVLHNQGSSSGMSENRFEHDQVFIQPYHQEEAVALHPVPETEPEQVLALANTTEEELIHAPESINYQALHTVDYFASQGIRINNDIKPDDKLGKQLKSFTEWLKTMRRLPETMVQEVLQNTNDTEVDQYAATSLEENEVLTEAMAEVLVKQGNYEKARGVYNKLSLLNPHKRAYFATKLEDLKKY